MSSSRRAKTRRIGCGYERHPDGAVVVFHDGSVTAGSWSAVCRAYPQPMRRVFARRELDMLVDAVGIVATAKLADTQIVDWVIA